MKRVAVAVIFLTCLSHAAWAQPQLSEQQTKQRIGRVAAKIKELSRPTASEEALSAACRKACSDAGPEVKREAQRSGERREANLNRYAAEIGEYVDAYTAHADVTDSSRLDRRLRTMLAGAAIAPPKVMVSDGVWIVAYIVGGVGVAGPMATRVSVRAYTPTDGHLQRIAMTGSDLDGRTNLTIEPLSSPTPGQVWLIVSGYMTGANGPNNAMRVYALEANSMRTVWARDTWGTFKVRPTPDGFRIDGDYYRTEKKRHDRYLLTESAVRLARK